MRQAPCVSPCANNIHYLLCVHTHRDEDHDQTVRPPIHDHEQSILLQL